MGVTLVNEALCYEQGCIKHPFNHMKCFSELKGENFVANWNILKRNNWRVKYWQRAHDSPNSPIFSHSKIFPRTVVIQLWWFEFHASWPLALVYFYEHPAVV